MVWWSLPILHYSRRGPFKKTEHQVRSGIGGSGALDLRATRARQSRDYDESHWIQLETYMGSGSDPSSFGPSMPHPAGDAAYVNK